MKHIDRVDHLGYVAIVRKSRESGRIREAKESKPETRPHGRVDRMKDISVYICWPGNWCRYITRAEHREDLS